MARILYAEDAQELRALIQDNLSHQGHQVVAVSDGVEALKELKKEGSQFDVLLTDLQMPNMDGRELVQTQEAQVVPIRMIYTATVDYLSKNFGVWCIPKTGAIIGRNGPSISMHNIVAKIIAGQEGELSDFIQR